VHRQSGWASRTSMATAEIDDLKRSGRQCVPARIRIQRSLCSAITSEQRDESFPQQGELVETQARETHAAAPIEPRWLWHPNLIVFVSSACTMVLELIAGRIVAPYVGVSLYTWTSIIGVVLAGISLGNYLGGRLADRWASGRLLGAVLSLGGVSSLGILTADLLDCRSGRQGHLV